MNLSRTQQVELLFEQSLEQPEDARRAWLLEQCADDPELYEGVCELCELQMEASDLFVTDLAVESPSTEQESRLQSGREIGDFRLERQIGEGGMGIVFKAVQKSLSRTVALKILRPRASGTPSLRKRFQIEVEAAARLQHPNIVGVYTTGSEDNLLYYAMEFIDGCSLADVISKLKANPIDGLENCASTAPLPASTDAFAANQLADTEPQVSDDAAKTVVMSAGVDGLPANVDNAAEFFDWAANRMAEVAEGVHFAHTNQVLHRDIKPSNLMLAQDGKARVGDFGLARDLSEPGITQTGELIGTPYYMAPEQLASGAAIDRAVDVYAIGATLYELLTLQPPFPGQTRDSVLARILHEEVQPPRTVNIRIPLDLETICLKALEKQASDRYSSAQELAADLRRYVRREPILARRAGMVDRAVKWIDRHRALAASMAALPVCVAIVATVFAIRNHRLATALELESNRANGSVFEAKLEQSRAILGTNSPTRRSDAMRSIQAAIDILPRLELTAQELDQRKQILRRELVSAMAVSELKEDRVWSVEKPWTSEVEFTSDYTAYAQPSREGPVRVRYLDHDTEIQLAGPTKPARQMKFSPNGRFLATKHYTRGPDNGAILYVWDMESPEEPFLKLSTRHIFVLDFDFSSDNRSFATVRAQGATEIYSLNSGELEQSIPRDVESASVLAYSSDDYLAITGYRRNHLEVWNTRGTPKRIATLEAEQMLTALAWSERGSQLAAGTRNGEILIWDKSLEGDPKLLRPHRYEIISVSFQPSGTKVATRTLNERVAISDTASLDSYPLSDPQERMHVMASGFSSDGLKLGYCRAREFGFYSVDKASLSVLASGIETKSIQDIGFHPQQKNLLARTVLDGVELWDTNHRRLLIKLPVDLHTRIEFTSDGKHLYASSLRQGVSRWELEQISDGEHGLQVSCGQRQVVYEGVCNQLRLGESRDIIAITHAAENKQSWQVVVMDGTGVELSGIDIPEKPAYISFQSEDKELATSQVGSESRQIWSVASGARVREDHFFVPDSLANFHQETGVWAHTENDRTFFTEANTGRILSSIPVELQRSRRIHFSRNGELAVTNEGLSAIKLIDTKVGRVLTTLRSRTQEGASAYAFNADGSQIAVAGFRDVHIWHLNAIEQDLRELNLCWDEE